tara:strand:- start:428 stop:646 length:219 start_codon:yes stop_codon:yes gene_type:complete
MNLYTEIKHDDELSLSDINDKLRRCFYTKPELTEIIKIVTDRFQIKEKSITVKWLVNGSNGLAYPMVLELKG